MWRSFVLSLSPQLVFPDEGNVITTNSRLVNGQPISSKPQHKPYQIISPFYFNPERFGLLRGRGQNRSDLLVGVVQKRVRFCADGHQRRVEIAVDDRKSAFDASLLKRKWRLSGLLIFSNVKIVLFKFVWNVNSLFPHHFYQFTIQ